MNDLFSKETYDFKKFYTSAYPHRCDSNFELQKNRCDSNSFTYNTNVIHDTDTLTSTHVTCWCLTLAHLRHVSTCAGVMFLPDTNTLDTDTPSI